MLPSETAMIGGHQTSRLNLGDGIDTRFLDTGGPGSPLVLIHGLAASIEIWARAIGPLSKRFRVLAFDLPGFGEASKPDAPYDPAFFVEQLKRFLDAMDLPRAHMFGSSMGASLIVRFSARHNSRIDRAILAAPGGFSSYIHPFLRAPTLPLIGGVMSRPSRAATAFAVKLSMADPAQATPAMIDLADRHSRLPGAHRAFVRTLRAIASPFGLRDLDGFARDAASLKQPVLALWGKQDRIFPAGQSDRVNRHIPQAEVRVLDACGHYPQWEQAEATAALAAAFLSGGNSRSAA
jgi:pimeloyl-ACP methyl ester carboxylesterase